MDRSETRQSNDIRHLVVGTIFESSEAFLNLCRCQTSHLKLLSSDDLKEIATHRFPGKVIWGAIEAVIPQDPHRYLFWLERLDSQLRLVGVERLTLVSRTSL
jgi:hypothetical protein